MNTYVKGLIIILVLVFFTSSTCSAEEIEMFIKNSFEKHCKMLIEFEILKTIKQEKTYSAYLRKDGRILPVHTNGEWVITGGIFMNNISVTNGELDKLYRHIFLDLRDKLDEYIRFKYTPSKASSSHEFLYLIYDTDCTYCNQIKSRINNICDKHNIALKIILSSFSSESLNDIVSLLNSEAKYIDFINPDFKPKHNLNENGITKIRNATKLLEKSGIFSTPTFIFSETGETLHGVSIEYLDEYLSSYFHGIKKNK